MLGHFLSSKFLLVMAFLVGLLLAESAGACDRCGLFGRRCRFASQSHHFTDHHDGYGYGSSGNSGTQTFNFINSYPLPLLATQGQTIYGFNLAAQSSAVDPALIFDTAARLAQNASDLAKLGVTGYSELASQQLASQQAIAAEALEVAKVQAQGQAAAAALSAAKPSSSAATPQLFSYRVTVTNGQTKIEEIDSATGQPASGAQLSAFDHAKALLSSKCGKCHSGAGAKATPFLDREITKETLEKIIARTTTDDPKLLMPPSGRLHPRELAPLFAYSEQLTRSMPSSVPRGASSY